MSFVPLPSSFTTFAVPGFRPGTVSLLINGMLYEGWLEVEISRSVKEMAGQFSLDVSERWGGGTDGPAVLLGWRITEGDPCQVLYAGVPAVTGYVDVYQPHYTATSHTVKIQGRSKTQDMVDSSAETDVPNGEMRESDLAQMARKVAKPHGIDVVVDAEMERFDVARVIPGETKHQFLERYGRPSGVAMTDDAEGRLRLLQVKAGAPVATLTEGVNILEGSATHRADKRYSDYKVKGQNHGSDDEFGAPVAEVLAEAKDAAVKRYRPHVIINETKTRKSDAKKRCDWEAATRAGESTKAEVEVVDWFCAPGKLWTPGDLVMVTSPMLRLNRALAIESVRLKQGKDGTKASLSLVPPEALNPKTKGGKNGKDAGSGGGDEFSDAGSNDAAWLNTKPTTAAV